MQKTIVLLFLFIGLFSFSQNSYIINKEGERIIVKDNSITIISIDQRLTYQMPDGTWEKYIKFKDLDYAMDGPYKIKAFKFEDKKKYSRFEPKKKYSAYYVITEGGKTLATKVSQISGGGGYNILHYKIIEDNKIIKYGMLIPSSKEKYRKKHREFIRAIKTHFKDCSKLIERLNNALKDNPDELKGNDGYIFDLFLSPIYIENCN